MAFLPTFKYLYRSPKYSASGRIVLVKYELYVMTLQFYMHLKVYIYFILSLYKCLDTPANRLPDFKKIFNPYEEIWRHCDLSQTVFIWCGPAASLWTAVLMNSWDLVLMFCFRATWTFGEQVPTAHCQTSSLLICSTTLRTSISSTGEELLLCCVEK
jgi:hypothetical protein